MMNHHLINKIKNDLWAIRPDYLTTLYHAALDFDGSGNAENSRGYTVEGSTAVVPVYGALGKNLTDFEALFMTDYNDIEASIIDAENDDSVETILLDINSPGGTIQGLPELVGYMRTVKKPLVSYTDGMMASAAYWLGTVSQHLLISQTAEVGSVGVYVALLDESRALEMQGYKVEAISAGKHKMDYSGFAPLSDSARARLQANVDKWHSRFKAAVRVNYPIDDEHLEGQTFEGEEALEVQMASGIVDSLSDALLLINE